MYNTIQDKTIQYNTYVMLLNDEKVKVKKHLFVHRKAKENVDPEQISHAKHELEIPLVQLMVRDAVSQTTYRNSHMPFTKNCIGTAYTEKSKSHKAGAS